MHINSGPQQPRRRPMLAKALTAGALTMAFASATLATHAMHRGRDLSTDQAVEALQRCDTKQKRDAASLRIQLGIERAIEELRKHGGEAGAVIINRIHEATR
jgi:hypothetical protein